MLREKMIRYGGPAAILGGALYIAASVATILIYFVFAKQARETFFGQHAFIHMLDTPMFALLALGAIGVYLRQSYRLSKVGKVGFWLTLAGFVLGVIGGAAIIVVGLAVSDEATLGVLDVIAHPLSMLLYAVGSVIFGVATFRAGVLPRGAALLAAIGPIWLFAMMTAGLVGPGQPWVLPLVPWVATGLGWAWLGYALLSEKLEPVPESQPVGRQTAVR